MNHSFFTDKLFQDIVCLLAVTDVPVLEKRVWLNLLPKLTAAQKTALKKNLENQFEEELKMNETALRKSAEQMSR